MQQLEPFQRLVRALSRLPGVGRRSAERMALRLALEPQGSLAGLRTALDEVAEQVCSCSRCGNLTLVQHDPCTLCTDARRNGKWLCVVEDPAGIQQMESAGAFNGRYHCLCGRIAPMRGQTVTPEQMDRLLHRVRQEGVEEVLLAFDSDVESDATSSYLQEQLNRIGVRITRLAFGIPAGSGLAYSDPVTLARALHGRQTY